MNDRSFETSPTSSPSSSPSMMRQKLLALASSSSEIDTAPPSPLLDPSLPTTNSISLRESTAAEEYNTPHSRTNDDQSSRLQQFRDEQVTMLNNHELIVPTANRPLLYWFQAFYFRNKSKLWTLFFGILVTAALLTCSIVFPPIPVLMSAIAVAGLTSATAQIISAAMLSVVYTATSYLLGVVLDKRRLARIDDVVFPEEPESTAVPIAGPSYSAKRVVTGRLSRINTNAAEHNQGNSALLSSATQTLFATPTSSEPTVPNNNSSIIKIGRSKAI